MSNYSNQGFDQAQHLANILTEADRKAGRSAPKYGYSQVRFAEAERVVRSGGYAAAVKTLAP